LTGPRLCQLLDGVPVAGLDQGDAGLESRAPIAGSSRSMRSSASAARSADSGLARGPGQDVEDVRDRSWRSEGIKATPEHPLGGAQPDVRRGRRRQVPRPAASLPRSAGPPGLGRCGLAAMCQGRAILAALPAQVIEVCGWRVFHLPLGDVEPDTSSTRACACTTPSTDPAAASAAVTTAGSTPSARAPAEDRASSQECRHRRPRPRI
jgi:hypothetical protein